MKIMRWLLMLLCCASSAQAATYWVSTSGNDANGCTASASPLTTTAKRTLDNAWNCLSPGDTLMVRGGTYAGLFLNNARGGNGTYKTLKPAPGETVILDAALTSHAAAGVISLWGLGANYVTIDGSGGTLRLTDSVIGPPDHASIQPTSWPCQDLWSGSNPCNGLTPGTDPNANMGCAYQIYDFISARRRGIEFDQYSITNRPHHIRILNVELTRLGQFALWGASDDLEVFNSHIHNNDLYGAYIIGYRHWIHNNHIHDNRSVGLRFGHDGDPGDAVNGKFVDSVVENNLIHDNYGRLLHISGNAPDSDLDTGGYGLICYGCSNNQIKNNVIYNNAWNDRWGNRCDIWGLMAMDRLSGANQISNNTVVGHNTTTATSASGFLQFPFGNQNDLVRNNILVDNKTNVVSGTNTAYANNLCSTVGVGCSIISATPGFVGGGNFRITTAGSPAVNAGINLYSSGVTTDADGVPRPSTGPFTIGAYEFAVDVNSYSVSRNLATVAGGGHITASWTVSPGPGQALDWIGLVATGQPAENFLLVDAAGGAAWTYTSGLNTGNYTLAAPLVPGGTYEFLYCVNDSFTCPARSAPFTIAPGTTATGLVVRRMRWHKADTPEAVDANDPDWIEGENDSIVIMPGGKVRYRVAIGFEGVTPPAFDYYALYCTLDGSTFTRLTTSCATFPLCIGPDSAKNSGDPTNRRLTMPAGYTGISGYFVVDSIDTGLTRQPTDKQQFEMEYGLTSNASTASGTALQCQVRHNNGDPLGQYLASSSLVLGLRSGTIKSGSMDSGRVR